VQRVRRGPRESEALVEAGGSFVSCVDEHRAGADEIGGLERPDRMAGAALSRPPVTADARACGVPAVGS